MLAVFGGPLGKGEAGREADSRRPAAVGGCVSPGGAAGAAGWGTWPPGQCSVPAEHPWRALPGGKEPSVSQQSSLVWEMGNYLGPPLQQMSLASLAKVVSAKGAKDQTWLPCAPLVPVGLCSISLPPLLPLALKKQSKSSLLGRVEISTTLPW